MPQLSCQNISLGYDAKIILRDLSFSVNTGDYLCVVGENGSGKTTLMKAILGLHPLISGQIITGDGLHSNEIGYLPQQSDLQKDFPASVREVVLSGCQAGCGLRPYYSKQEKLLAASLMEKVHISDLAKSCYRELSGGQQQRVLLARALCATRKLLMLDEPVSGLDPNATAEMYRLMNELNQSDGITIIMISHDIHTAIRYASHILHIGEQIFFGTKEDFLQNAISHRFTGLQQENIS